MKILTPMLILCSLSLLLFVSADNSKAAPDFKAMREMKINYLLWGHYRPHRLSVVTQRSKNPMSVGLLFSDNLPWHTHRTMYYDRLRERVSKPHISVEYLANDGERFSQQLIVDQQLNVSYNVTFLKINSPSSPHHSWLYLVEPFSIDSNSSETTINTFVYLSAENYGGTELISFKLVEESEDHYLIEAYDAANNNALKGYFDIEIIRDEPPRDSSAPTEDNLQKNVCENKEIWQDFQPQPQSEVPIRSEAFMCYMNLHLSDTWNVGKHIYSHLIEESSTQMKGFNRPRCTQYNSRFNLGVLHLRGSKLDYKVKVSYHSQERPKNYSVKEIEYAYYNLNGFFQQRLEKYFPLRNPPVEEAVPVLQKVRAAALSNMLGGLSYSYGDILVNANLKLQENRRTSNAEKKELFTSTPSRVTFPRGFLWDEGFHLLLLCRWDHILCMEIVASWLNTQTSTGWIPREQARGSEQENVFTDKRFLYQNELEANPPTLLFALEMLMTTVPDKTHPSYKNVVDFLNSGVEEKVIKWFEFFNTTQRNFEAEQDPQFTGPLFKWHCVEPCERGNIMGSGLDDYPRADPLEEPVASLDLQVWMIYMVKTINMMKTYKGEARDKRFRHLEKDLIKSLEQFKDSKDHYYKDIVQDLKESVPGKINKKFNSHFGYVNLFPFLFGLVPRESESYKMVIALISHPKALWSEHGLRSLAEFDKGFLGGERYWTEPIWMNINYLVVRAFVKYYSEDPTAVELYRNLRSNLMRTVTLNYINSHTFWENYSSISGKGQRSPGFYGWTALVVLMMSEMY